MVASRETLALANIQLILPYVDVDLKYYDLGMESRDAASASRPRQERRSRPDK